MRLTTPERVRTLQRKLYRKAKHEPAYRFYSLYDKVHRADILSHAWNLVRSNKGSAGIDGGPPRGVSTRLSHLSRETLETALLHPFV